MDDATDLAGREGGAPARLVGRASEQEALCDLLDAALVGQGRLVLIAGEAGIGKTALAEACRVAASQRGMVTLTGRSYDLTETPPYGPWRELLSQYPALPDLPIMPLFFTSGGALAEAHNQAALFARIRDFLRTLATQTPVMLFVDDAQWADPGSLDLLRVLARDLGDYPVLLVVTYRGSELTADHPFAKIVPLLVREAKPVRFTLRPLDDDAVRALIAERYGIRDEQAHALIGYLQARAEGNPFFIGELLHALADDGRLLRAEDSWTIGDLTEVAVPPLLRQVIERRIARLGHVARRVLPIAAVIGPEVPLALWAKVANVDEGVLLDVIEQAVAARELTETEDGSGVRFAHALIRETLYTGVLAARRRGWHRAIAEILAAEPHADPDAVAYHLLQTGDARAADWLIRAGDRASAAFAYQSAIARFTDALTAIGDDAAHAVMRCEVLIRLARLLRITDTPRAIAFEEEALRLATQARDEVLQAVARFRLGYLFSYVGQRQRGLALQLEGLMALDALPAEAMARVAPLEFICADFTSRHSSVAQRLVQIGSFQEAESHAALALAAVNGALNRYSEDAWMALAILDRDMGRPEEGWRKSLTLYATFRERGEYDIATWLVGGPLIWAALSSSTDDHARLREMLALVDAHMHQAGELFARLPVQVLQVPVLYVEGAWAQARQVIAAVRRSPYARHEYTRGAWLVQSLIAIAQGETDAAWALVHAEFPLGAETEPGNHRYGFGVFFQQIAVTLALDAGDLVTARSWLEAHDRWLAWSGAVLGQAEGHFLWARYYRAQGDDATAVTRATQALRAAKEPRQPLTLLAAHRLLGELQTTLGQFENASAHLDAALALADACQSPYERALTLLAQAELRDASGDPASASALLDDVHVLLAPLGARPALTRANALAARLSPSPVPAGLALPDGLTAREAEILRVLAAGLSNREIAEALSLSVRTVERHINNVYTKIDARGRAEATAYAFRHGLT